MKVNRLIGSILSEKLRSLLAQDKSINKNPIHPCVYISEFISREDDGKLISQDQMYAAILFCYTNLLSVGVLFDGIVKMTPLDFKLRLEEIQQELIEHNNNQSGISYQDYVIKLQDLEKLGGDLGIYTTIKLQSPDIETAYRGLQSLWIDMNKKTIDT